MLAEGIHSVIDAGIVSLMLVGVNRSEKPPDRRHPFGHAQELYYWTNVVALLLFSLGGGMSLLEGVNRLLDPQAPESPYWSYGVLAVSAALGAYSISAWPTASCAGASPEKSSPRPSKTARTPAPSAYSWLTPPT